MRRGAFSWAWPGAASVSDRRRRTRMRILASDPAVASSFSVVAPPALTPPAPPSPRGRGGKKPKGIFFFSPSSPPGGGGVGEVRGRRRDDVEAETTAGSETRVPAILTDIPGGTISSLHHLRREMLPCSAVRVPRACAVLLFLLVPCLSAEGIKFREVSKAWHIDFRHHTGGTGQRYMVETMVGGVVMF